MLRRSRFHCLPLAQAPGDRRLGTVEEIAVAERINPSYVSRVLRLTLLAPGIVEAIVDGRQPADLTLAVLMKPPGGVEKAGPGAF